MTVLIDTNVALDYLLHRKDYHDAAAIFVLAEKAFIAGYISASAITDIFFLSKGKLGKKPAKEALKNLLHVFKPATVTDSYIFQALELDWDDFEDSVQFTVGEGFSADYIVTRNTQDFFSSHIPVVTPKAFMQIITDNE
jgi:predicted nucleic acid-binding protein